MLTLSTGTQPPRNQPTELPALAACALSLVHIPSILIPTSESHVMEMPVMLCSATWKPPDTDQSCGPTVYH